MIWVVIGAVAAVIAWLVGRMMMVNQDFDTLIDPGEDDDE